MNDLELLGLGALLAVVGGALGDEFRSWRENGRERASIKVCLADELREIEAVISRMHEVWGSAATLHPSYVTDLLGSTSAYDTHRPRLFLIKDLELRKQIGDFYKKMKDAAKKAEGKLGTLSDTAEAKAEQTAMDASFQAVSADAKTLREKLENS